MDRRERGVVALAGAQRAAAAARHCQAFGGSASGRPSGQAACPPAPQHRQWPHALVWFFCLTMAAGPGRSGEHTGGCQQVVTAAVDFLAGQHAHLLCRCRPARGRTALAFPLDRCPCRCARAARPSARHGGWRLRRGFRGRAGHGDTRLAGLDHLCVPGRRKPRPLHWGEFCFAASLDGNSWRWPAGLAGEEGMPTSSGHCPPCQLGTAARQPPERPRCALLARNAARDGCIDTTTPSVHRRNAPVALAPVAPAATLRRPEVRLSRPRCAPPVPRRRRWRHRTPRRPSPRTGRRTPS